MQIIVTQEDLSKALSNAVRFVTIKSQLPILSNILVEADKDQVTITASDLDISLKQVISASVEVPGKITVPAKELTEYISYLEPGKVTLSLSETKLLTVTSQKSSASFATQESDEFPPFPTLSASSSVILETSGLEELIASVAPASAAEDTRPVLTAILTKLEPGKLTLTATDGFRLSHNYKPLDASSSTSPDLSVLIPQKTFLEAIKLSKGTQKINLQFDTTSNQVIFSFENNQMLASRLIQGEFPPYERIIPKATTTTILISKEEFVQAVKSASIFARASANVSPT